MIHHQITPAAPLAPHSCGRAPQLIEVRGRSLTDPRLLGKPARIYHVECARCQVASIPAQTPAEAEARWAHQGLYIVRTDRLPALRIAAEQSLAAAA